MNTKKKRKDTTPAANVRRAQLTMRISFRIDPELEDRFKKAAFHDGRSRDSAIRWTMAQYCNLVESSLDETSKQRIKRTKE